MGKIRARAETGYLYFDFVYRGVRCREQTRLADTQRNRSKLQGVLKRIESEISLDIFEYAEYFPNSSRARRFASRPRPAEVPYFRDFAWQWYGELRPQWRKSYAQTVEGNLRTRLIPGFGDLLVDQIAKPDLLSFRGNLSAEVSGRTGRRLSPSRVNRIMMTLRAVLTEAAERFEFSNPCRGIRALPVPRSSVEPFTLDEVGRIIDVVPPEHRNYYTVRFFTGLRTGEIDGLKWKYVDFERREILVRESLVGGEIAPTKTDGSVREVRMSNPVHTALLAQERVSRPMSEFVFCTGRGTPVNYVNMTNRVWKRALEQLGLRYRRAYQTRHTAATLWLAAGESPEWIARQLGHSSTEMLFRVYSRFVPNLTRNDGTAFDRLIQREFESR